MHLAVPVLVALLGQQSAPEVVIVEPEKVFGGHEADVYDVAFSPRSGALATASFDKTVKVWDVGDGTESVSFDGHTGKVLSVDFSPDGRQLLTASEDSTVRLWNIPVSGPLAVLETEGAVRDLELAAQGRVLAVSTADAVRLWDRQRREVIAQLEPGGPVKALAGAASAPAAAVLLESGQARVWDFSRLIAAPEVSSAGGEVVLAAADGEWRYRKGKDDPPAAWKEPEFDASGWPSGSGGFGYSSNLSELETVRTRLDDMRGDEGYLSFYIIVSFRMDDPGRVEDLALRILYDDSFVAYLNGEEVGRKNVDGSPPGYRQTANSAGEPERTEIDLKPHRGKLRAGRNVLAIEGHNANTTSSDFVLTPELRARLAKAPEKKDEEEAAERALAFGDGEPRALALSPDGARIAAALGGGSVRVRDVGGADLAAIEIENGSPVTSLAFVTGDLLATGADDGRIRIWKLGDSSRLHELEGHEGPVRDMAFDARRGLLASAGSSGRLGIWDAAGGKRARSIDGHDGAALSVAWSRDGARLVSSGEDAKLLVWSVDDGKRLQSFSGSGAIRAAAAIDSTYFGAVGSKVETWRPVMSGEAQKLEGHDGIVHMAAFSPDGSSAASAGSDKTVRLWNLGDGKQLRSIEAHESSVYCVEFSPDGALVASGGYDTLVKFWNVGSGAEERSLAGHGEGVFNLRFSPDGETLFSCSSDGTVRSWSVSHGKEIAVYDGHPGWVMGIALHPDAATLISVDYGGHLINWSAEDGSILAHRRIQPNVPVVYDIAISPDGKWIATANRAGNSHLVPAVP